jgi:hypothetical protein
MKNLLYFPILMLALIVIFIYAFFPAEKKKEKIA